MREKLYSDTTVPRAPGITPACAGKTLQAAYSDRTSRDHPRVCGKNSYATYGVNLQRGSPPRVREKRKLVQFLQAFVGITPACAGKTSVSSKLNKLLQDHPRVCGKNVKKLPYVVLKKGSPPRVREKQQKDPVQRPVLLQKMDKFIHFCCKQCCQPCILKRPMWQFFNDTILS